MGFLIHIGLSHLSGFYLYFIETVAANPASEAFFLLIPMILNAPIIQYYKDSVKVINHIS